MAPAPTPTTPTPYNTTRLVRGGEPVVDGLLLDAVLLGELLHLVRELELVDRRLELGHAHVEGVASVEDRGSGRRHRRGRGDERADEETRAQHGGKSP